MALSSVHRFIPVYGPILISLFGLGSTIRVTVSPNQFTPLIHNDLNMTCVTEGPSYWAKQVIVIEIGRVNEKPMAVINQKGDVTMGPSSLPNMKAEGHIDPDASKSFLTVIINKPTVDEAGTYSCKSFYLDEEYQMQVQEEFFNVTVDNQDTTSMISYVIGKLSDLEKIVQHQNDTIAKQNYKIQKQDDKLEEYNHTMQKQEDIIHDQNDRIKGLQNQHDLIKEKDPKICAFSMWYGSKGKAIYQQPLVFTEAITNIGNAYNVSTGKFTAPYTGVYVFHLTLATMWTNKPADVGALLSKNGVTNVAVVDAGDKDNADQSSNSVVLSLQAGDLVWPWLGGIYGMDTLHPSYTQFSGYLIAAS